MENRDIREIAKEKKIPLWKIASKIGVCELTLQRWLRFPLDEEKKKKVLIAFNSIEDERKEVAK